MIERPTEPRAQPVTGAIAVAAGLVCGAVVAILVRGSQSAQRGDALFGGGVAHASAVEGVLDVERETGAGAAAVVRGGVVDVVGRCVRGVGVVREVVLVGLVFGVGWVGGCGAEVDTTVGLISLCRRKKKKGRIRTTVDMFLRRLGARDRCTRGGICGYMAVP